MNDHVTRPEFQKVITILERIEVKLTEIDVRLGAVDVRLGEVDVRLGEVDVRLGVVDERTRRQGVLHERLESKVDAVIEVLGTKASTSDVEKLRAEIVPRLDVLESAMRAR